MTEGERIKVAIYDSLFKDYIISTGVLLRRVYKGLWMFRPDKNRRLNGNDMQIHESWKI